MADKTLPVGSIIRTEGKLGIIAGIRFEEEAGRLVKSYLCAAYPAGFTGAEHLRLIPASRAELVSEGYRSPAAEPFLTFWDSLDTASDMADAKTVHALLEEAYAKLHGGEHGWRR